MIESVGVAMALKLAKAGYYGGNPESVMKARVDMVVSAIEYEHYLAEYEAEYRLLNKEGES